ncbi:MAG: hypothetical protein WAL87_02645 [Chthoniobacterales bacterium]
MQYPGIILTACCLTLAACGRKMPEQPSIECIPAKVSVGEKQIETVLQWNPRTGEARLLNAAPMCDQSTGKQGSMIGWVPVVDLQQSLRNLPNTVIPSQAEKASATPVPTPQPTIQPEAPKKPRGNKGVAPRG